MTIRLICSDIDGTPLQYGKKELEDEIFEQIRELHRRDILFCPASGRQYTSLCKLFAPVADCCVFLCENGGVIYKDEQCIAKNPMPRALAEEIANDLWTRSDGQGEVMLSGQNTAYLMERGLGMLKRIPAAPAMWPTHGIPGTLKLPGRICWKAARLCWKNCADRRIL